MDERLGDTRTELDHCQAAEEWPTPSAANTKAGQLAAAGVDLY